MGQRDLTATFSVTQSPEAVFAAINDVRGWWSGDIEGDTDRLGAVFTYRNEDVHRSTQEIVELVPERRVVWRVVDSYLSFLADKTEWNGTRIVFDITPRGERTELRFTHEGIDPDQECFGVCSKAWTFYVTDSLKNLVVRGSGTPNPKPEARAAIAI
jgi:activator of Hsp90 ATPase-like protein